MEKIKIYESLSAEQTQQIAREIGQRAKSGEVYCLCGELAAGKTVFAGGFAEGLEIEEDISSPTFAIVNTYEGRLPFYHFDVYRIVDVDEMEETGFEDYVYGDGVCLIEWAELIKEIIPASAVWIEITKDYAKGEDYRRICVK